MQSFPYNNLVYPGKAYVTRLHGNPVMYVYSKSSKAGSKPEDSQWSGDFAEGFMTYEDAKIAVALHNDWQVLGTKGHEVYKGNAVFNKAFNAEPWEHVYLSKDKVFFFVWDTRELTKVYARPDNLTDVAISQYLRIETSDNHKPIAKHGKWLNLSELLAMPVNAKTLKQMKQ